MHKKGSFQSVNGETKTDQISKGTLNLILLVLLEIKKSFCQCKKSRSSWFRYSKRQNMNWAFHLKDKNDKLPVEATVDVLTASKNVVNLVENRTVNFEWLLRFKNRRFVLIRINKVDLDYSYWQNWSLVFPMNLTPQWPDISFVPLITKRVQRWRTLRLIGRESWERLTAYFPQFFQERLVSSSVRSSPILLSENRRSKKQ